MKTGIELITEERKEQIEKHGRTLESDAEVNTKQQLSFAASQLLGGRKRSKGWDLEIWSNMALKPYKERLIIAGALIAAELDRIS